MRDTAPAVGTDCLAHTADLHSFPSRRKFKKKEEKTLYIYIHVPGATTRRIFMSDISTHIPRIWPLYPLHGYALSRSTGITLLRHPLAVSSKRRHAWGSRLVYTHWRPAHIGVVHGRSHAGWIHSPRGTSWAWLIHKLAIVGWSMAHLERWTHLEKTTE